MGGMNQHPRPLQLPHHRLAAFQVAVEFLTIIKDARIRDAKLRDDALRAAKSVCCNVAEGAGRWTRPDKTRAFSIARGEAIEAIGALEAAAAAGDANAADVDRALPVASRLYALLTGLIK
jgi:four helix bundle protein